MQEKTIKSFWNKFYKNKLALDKPSGFAIFICKFLKNYKSIVVDIGCGNGRDLLYFKKNRIDFLGIDLSKYATFFLRKKFVFFVFMLIINNINMLNFNFTV